MVYISSAFLCLLFALMSQRKEKKQTLKGYVVENDTKQEMFNNYVKFSIFSDKE